MDLEKQLKIATEESATDELSKRSWYEYAEHIASRVQVDIRKPRRIAAIALVQPVRLEEDS